MSHTISRPNQILNFLSDSIYDSHALNFWLKKINPLWSANREMLGQIVDKQQIADNMIGLTIRCNGHMQFGQAGQHHPVIIEINGRRYERTYSLTHLDAQHVQLNVKKVAHGMVSQWLCETAQAGDIIEFGQPFGEVQLRQFATKDLILLAAGSGITPIYSLLHQLDQTGEIKNFHIQVLYWAKQPHDFAFKTTLETWQQHYPENLHIDFFCTQSSSNHPRLNVDYLQHLGDLSNKSVFACGTSGFVNTAAELFVNAKQFQGEAFSLSALNSETDTATVNVTLSKSNKTINIAKGQPILLALEQANIKPMHGCRMGICNKCSCKKVSGATKNLNDQSEHQEPNYMLRICVNSAQSDLILDI